MSEPSLLLHIGMPKAASSYLHDAVFPALAPGRYIMPGARNAKLPRYRFRRNAFGVRRFADAFHRDSGFWSRHGEAFLAQFLAPALSGGRARESVLVSEEAVTRLNHFKIRSMPGAFHRDELERRFRSFAHTARRFGFCRVKVLLMTRRQDRLLAASYAQLSRKIVRASQEDFERRVKNLLHSRCGEAARTFYPLEYNALYQSLVQSLGQSNVSFVPFEMIGENFPEFLDVVSKFFACDRAPASFSSAPINSRASGTNQWRLRSLLAFKSPHGNFEITLPRRLTARGNYIELTPRCAEEIMRYYRPSNKTLSDTISVDLSRFGYCAA